MPDLLSDDLYQRLGIPSTATADEIRRAYRELLRRYPPERAPEEFMRIQEAYDTLRDPQTREEYGNQTDQAVSEWINSALAAMHGENYGNAELYLKAVLKEYPGLTFARNLLGVVLLHLDRPLEAIEHFEILLSTSDQSPVWYGNAGEAYRRAGRHREAERAFRRAILSGEDVAPYYLRLADLYIEQKEYGRATQILEKAILHDGQIDFNDFQYFTKLIQVHVIAGAQGEMEKVLLRLRALTPDLDGSQREYAALTLGNLAGQLLIALKPEHALTIIEVARDLAPLNRDYSVIEEVATCITAGDLEGATRLVRTEPVLKPGGWLAELGLTILHYEKLMQEQRRESVAQSPGDDDPAGGCLSVLMGFIILTAVIMFLASLCSGPSQSSTSQSSTSAPAVGTAATSEAASPRARLRSWIDQEQERLTALEGELNGLAERAARLGEQIDRIAHEIDAIERRYPNGIPGARYQEYLQSVERHNDLVRDQHTLVERHKRLRTEYLEAIEVFNKRVDDYNARRY